jgi:hypothetical protein
MLVSLHSDGKVLDFEYKSISDKLVCQAVTAAILTFLYSFEAIYNYGRLKQH